MSEAPKIDRPYQLCFSSMGWPEASWAELSTLARRYGFECIELRSLNGQLDLLSAMQTEFGSPDAMGMQIQESGLSVVGLNSSRCLLAPDPKREIEVELLAKWADLAGIPYVRVFDGKVGNEKDPIGRICQALDAWDQINLKLGGRCELLVETHDFLTDSEQVLKLAERRSGKLNLLWDACHTWRLSGRAPEEDWAQLKPYVKHIHVKDGVWDASYKGGFRYVLPGIGIVPILPLLHRLCADSFAGIVSLEWEKLWHASLPSLEMALKSGCEHRWWPEAVC